MSGPPTVLLDESNCICIEQTIGDETRRITVTNVDYVIQGLIACRQLQQLIQEGHDPTQERIIVTGVRRDDRRN